MKIMLKPVGFVQNSRPQPTDDLWEGVVSEIQLANDVPTEALDEISSFSHLHIIYLFDKVDESDVLYAGHPRGNPAFPRVGIFAQRKKDRPNRLGLATVELLEHSGRTIRVKYLDAIDGTPVLDIKPVFKEFEPRGQIKEPPWVAELMKQYWTNERI